MGPGAGQRHSAIKSMAAHVNLKGTRGRGRGQCRKITLLCDAAFMTPWGSDRGQTGGCGEGDDGTAHRRHSGVLWGGGTVQSPACGGGYWSLSMC